MTQRDQLIIATHKNPSSGIAKACLFLFTASKALPGINRATSRWGVRKAGSKLAGGEGMDAEGQCGIDY